MPPPRPGLPILQPGIDRRGLIALGLVAGLGACADDLEQVSDVGLDPADDASSSADSGEGPSDAGHGLTDSGEPDSGGGAVDAGSDGGLASDARSMMVPPGFVAVGPISGFPLNRWSNRGAANNAFIVGRDDAGVFIYTAVCTHSGCLVPAPRGPRLNSVCPCHASVFDDQGARLSGPARGPLTHRAAVIVDGVLYVHPTMNVSASTRTPVP